MENGWERGERRKSRDGKVLDFDFSGSNQVRWEWSLGTTMSRFFHFFPLFNIACSVGLLFVCSFMEIWRDWNISEWCSCGGFATLWTSAFKMLKGHGNFDYLNWVFVRHRENWIAAGVILLIGFVLGWVIKAMTYLLKIIIR